MLTLSVQSDFFLFMKCIISLHYCESKRVGEEISKAPAYCIISTKYF